MRKTWTKEDLNFLLDEVNKNPLDKAEAFKKIARTLKRTPHSVSAKYYKGIYKSSKIEKLDNKDIKSYLISLLTPEQKTKLLNELLKF